MPLYGTWTPYSGWQSLLLAVILSAAAAAFFVAGKSLNHPLKPAFPGKTAAVFIIIIWFMSVIMFLTAYAVYLAILDLAGLTGSAAENPVTPITLSLALTALAAVFWGTRKHGMKIALLSGIAAAMAGPMFFELPFDLVAMFRTYPAIPPNPMLFRALHVFPLFLVEISTIFLLTLSPLVKITRPVLYAMAGMFAAMAAWGLSGFAYPFDPWSFGWNITAKTFSFATAALLFLPLTGHRK